MLDGLIILVLTNKLSMTLINAIQLQTQTNNMVKEHQTAYGLITDGLIFLAHTNTHLMIQISVEELVDQVSN